MFTVEVVTVIMLVVTLLSLFTPEYGTFGYNLCVFLILFVTLLFANFAAAIQDPEQYLKDNREMFERYKEVKASDAYKNTPGYRLQELFAQLNRENGYNDVFIPAMRRLSSSYREYYEKLLKANEVFLKSYRRVRF